MTVLILVSSWKI